MSSKFKYLQLGVFFLILALLGGALGTVPVQADQLKANETEKGTETLQGKAGDPVVGEFELPATQIDITFPTVVASAPQHGDLLSAGIASVTIQFSTDMLADGTAFAVDSISNYLLVEAGEDGKFQTSSCARKRGGDDIRITVNTALYDSTSYSTVLSINGGTVLSKGSYQLLVCGSTRINDILGNKLNGGTDTVIRFIVAIIPYDGFGQSSIYYDSSGFQAWAVDIGDLNHDGFKDVAMATKSKVQVFLQNDAGTLTTPISYPAGLNSIAVVVGDLNNDGRDDLVTGDAGSKTISVFLQQSDGLLADRVTYPTIEVPYSIAIGDVNGDQLTDIVVVPSLGVFTQNVNGSFNPMKSHSSIVNSDDVAIGDVNHDGRNDVVLISKLQNPSISVYQQNVDGTLASAVSYLIGCSHCFGRGIEIGDVTGDGLSDVIAGLAMENKLAVFVQGKNGLLRAPNYYSVYGSSTAIELGDVNLDGVLDILASDGNTTISALLQQNGTLLPFKEYDISTGFQNHPQAMAVGDLDEDGAVDVAAAQATQGLTVLHHRTLPMPQIVHGGNSFPLDGEELGIGTNKLAVQFNRPMNADGNTAAANNSSNYLLVEDGMDNTFQTSSCSVGASSDDTEINIESIDYNASRQYASLSINSGRPLGNGQYRLFVCSTIETGGLERVRLNKGLSDLTIDFSVWLTPYTISGNTELPQVTLSYFDGSPKTAVTDGSGDYSFKVSEDWSGTVTPARIGFTFSPVNRVYAHVVSNMTSENYTFTNALYTISGNVGMSDVLIEEYTLFNEPPSYVMSDLNGDYSITVPYGWRGRVRPVKRDFSFSPSGRDYYGVVSDIADENYVPVANPYTISGNVGLADVSVEYEGDTGLLSGIAISDENGNYSFTVPENWTGRVSPYRLGYRFTPGKKIFSYVQADQVNQDFIPQKVYTISGNTGVAWAALNFTDETARIIYANNLGNYSLQVPEGWSGIVTPSRAGYTFAPGSILYTNLTEDQPNQDYVPNLIPITISGNTGIADATISYVDGVEKTILSDGNGDYSLTVPYYWSGSLKPSKAGYRFTPLSRNFYSLQTNQSNQNFTAERVYTISGNAGIAGATLRYMDGTLKSALSDGSGNYSFSVLPGWSGIVTPTKPGYVFLPVTMSYDNLSADQFNQDYTATAVFSISGNVGVIGATLRYMEDGVLKTVSPDSSGNYIIIVKRGWSGVITPSKEGVTFDPPTRAYTDVQADQPNSSYIATIWVNNTLDMGEGSLRQAVNDAVSGATIRFDPSLAGATITLASQIDINKNLIVDGSSLETRVSISGNNAVRMFRLDRYVITMRSLILKDGNSTGPTSSNQYGGALYITDNIGGGPTITLENMDFSGNDAYQGGAIYANALGKITIIRSRFLDNTSQTGGGAIYIARGDLVVTDSLFENNHAQSDGGAISFNYSFNSLIENVAFEKNSGSYGGAIFYDQSTSNHLTIRNNLFSGNYSTDTLSGGGAIRIHGFYEGSTNLLENNTFFENQSAGVGGAILSSGNWLLKNNTFSNNRADRSGDDSGSSLYLSSARTVLYNNIFANSIGGKECAGLSSTITGSNNLVEDGSGECSILLGTMIADPVLGPLADNGGPTQTMALLPGSPAIDTGDDVTCGPTDQRGAARPQGSHCDIGAYESDKSKVEVVIGTSMVESYFVPPQESQRKSYSAVNAGPLRLTNADGLSIMAAERVIYKVNNTPTSFSELIGLPASQLDTTYWLPWYNNATADLDTQLRFANISDSTATVHIYIGGQEMGTGFTLAAGESTRKSFAGINNGPVQIQSDQEIVVAERVIFKANGVATSFSEMMALPNSQLNTTYWLPWYNNKDFDTQLRFANVTDQPANVYVSIGGVEMPGSPFTLLAGESIRKSFTGVNNGPVKIVSEQKIVAAERVIYKVNGVNTSFSEMMALPDSQLNTMYWMPWYNNNDLDTQLRFANLGNVPASVHVYIGGQEMAGSPFTLLAGESTRKSFPGVNDGPVKIVSDQNIIAAERVIYKVNGMPTSFSEMMGLPDNLLDVTFWFPWYNNVDLDTQLRFGIP